MLGVPDGTTAEDHQDGQPPEDPGTPEEQISREVATAEALEWLTGIFGGGWERQSGGGGQGGQFMFADLGELDGIITAWRDEVEDIKSDLRQIEKTTAVVARPAGDPMSTLHMATTRQSLLAMREHSRQMLEYAQGYLDKLEQTRTQMQSDEDAVQTSMRNVYQA